MLASVSPESYRAIINGQSDWGIFPLLLDFSIIKDLGATVPSFSHVGYRPVMARHRFSTETDQRFRITLEDQEEVDTARRPAEALIGALPAPTF